jgi:dihydrofolate synthase / folylpolyglutamate synthase
MDELAKINALAKKEYVNQKPGLQRIRKVLVKVFNPQNSYPVVHIAGTNGKGSTATIVHSILVAAGYKVGLYTSPHFIDCRERIRINDKLISKPALQKYLAIIFAIPETAELTYFEILTVLAFKYFADNQVDIVVCEVGLGGRLDATNVVMNKLVSVITSIDYDHKEFLGNTLLAIAKEKAGIIKRGVPTVINSGHRSLDTEFSKICLAKKAPVYFLNKHFAGIYINTDWQNNQQVFTYQGIASNYKNLVLGLLGQHQVHNASLALACIEIIKKTFHIAEQAIVNGLQNAYWPGRFEVLQRSVAGMLRTIILDGAHNEAGIKVFKETFQASIYAKQQNVFIMSILKDKNYQQMCADLSVIAHKVIIFNVHPLRGLPNEALAEEWAKYLPDNKINVINKFSEFTKVITNSEKVICVTGSLYAISEAIKYVKSHS